MQHAFAVMRAAATALLMTGVAHAQQTTSIGYIFTQDYRSVETVAIDYHTRISAIIEGSGQIVYDQTFAFNAFGDPVVQAGVASARQALTDFGGPAIVIFGPANVEYEEVYEDVFSSTSIFHEYSTVVTTQQVFGADLQSFAFTGDRGECYDFGADGPVNFGDGSGRFANCLDSEEQTFVAAGDTLTNTHTTTVDTEVTLEFTNYDIAIYEHWQLVGRLQAIGHAHAAAQAASFRSSRDFLMQLDGLSWGDLIPLVAADRSDSSAAILPAADVTGSIIPSGFSVWAKAHGSYSDVDADGSSSGWNTSGGGMAAGLVHRWDNGLHVGVAGDMSQWSAAVNGTTENAALDSFFLAAQAGMTVDQAFVTFTAFHGWQDVNASREPAPGLAAEGHYTIKSYGGSAQAGMNFQFGNFTVAPRAGLHWIVADLPSFTETGSFALSSDGTTSDMIEAAANLSLRYDHVTASGGFLSLGAGVELTQILDEAETALPLTFSNGASAGTVSVASFDDTQATATLSATYLTAEGVALQAEAGCGFLNGMCKDARGTVSAVFNW